MPRLLKPAEPPGIWDKCDAGWCNLPADVWIWDSGYGCWIKACRYCANREEAKERIP